MDGGSQSFKHRPLVGLECGEPWGEQNLPSSAVYELNESDNDTSPDPVYDGAESLDSLSLRVWVTRKQ